MIKNILIFSLKNRWVVVCCAAALLMMGYFCFTQLKIEAYPDIADTNVIVVAQYPGHPPPQLRVPIARPSQNPPRAMDRRSRTIFGLSVVQLTFQDKTDDYFARQQIIE